MWGKIWKEGVCKYWLWFVNCAKNGKIETEFRMRKSFFLKRNSISSTTEDLFRCRKVRVFPGEREKNISFRHSYITATTTISAAHDPKWYAHVSSEFWFSEWLKQKWTEHVATDDDRKREYSFSFCICAKIGVGVMCNFYKGFPISISSKLNIIICRKFIFIQKAVNHSVYVCVCVCLCRELSPIEIEQVWNRYKSATQGNGQ